jgi:UDP-galactopyranose mutase
LYVEEPVWGKESYYEIENKGNDIYVIRFHVPDHLSRAEHVPLRERMLKDVFAELDVQDYICWFYTPMAWLIAKDLKPLAIVYDCMDELSAFKSPPEGLQQFELELFRHADVVFTGGYSLYHAKKHLHNNIHPFPSSIDQSHFNQGRTALMDPDDQSSIDRPRFGFSGVIDERMDLALLREVATLQPAWQFIMIGPTAKVNPSALPDNPNIHYLGMKPYQELPYYMAHWDVAMIPFALNEATAFISPTKTPEYLAGGKPVISTAIKDVINPYGEEKLVHIIHDAQQFVKAGEIALAQKSDKEWLNKVDVFLSDNSWDKTWEQMNSLIVKIVERKRGLNDDTRTLKMVG